MLNDKYKGLIQSVVVYGDLPDEEKGKIYKPLVDFHKLNTPKDLYRFRSCKERTISEFEQDILGFSPASEMNDDFDGMLCFDKGYIRTKLMEIATPQKISEFFETHPVERKNRIPENIFYQMINSLPIPLSNAMTELSKQFIDFAIESYDERMSFLSHVAQNQKIACFSSDITSSAMWGYYANNGTGFALSYDLREPHFEKYCLLPVIYGDKRFDATEYAIWLFQQQLMQRILTNANVYDLYQKCQKLIPCPDEFTPTKALLHKGISWSHEKEWRLVFYESGNPNGVKYPHIFQRPTAIYLGRNISPIYEKILHSIATEKNIPVYKMTICENSPTYELSPQIL